MKFEKFFKSVGTHGLIVKASGGESWLLCDGVGMLIPAGVNNLGVSVEPEPVFNAIMHSDADDNDALSLIEAVLTDPEGKAKDIIRVFENDLGERIAIHNAQYGLLEKKDRLSYLEIEIDDPEAESKTRVLKHIVVRDDQDNIVGFITGFEL